ncbi:30274_t:CDS:2 [Gigaspora margarita]|uniref:30274_t:CDS:1 n=1 Tax=Gigaspora margarita TaxID=4874 RepID=A0ABN7UY64_GIGMA|nr:30274_t:CDS:2 [Gigaspora margarita]
MNFGQCGPISTIQLSYSVMLKEAVDSAGCISKVSGHGPLEPKTHESSFPK